MPARTPVVALSIAGLVAPIWFTTLVIVQGILQPDYSHIAMPVSALAAWPAGWMQRINFYVCGALMAAFTIAVHRSIRPTWYGVVGIALLFTSCVGLVLAGLFPWILVNGVPTETKLRPDADPEYAELCRHAAGARRVLPYLGKPVEATDLVAMAAAYHGSLVFLDRNAAAIAKVFSDLPALRDTPLRVLLRSTGDYVHAQEHPQSLWPPLLEAETEQLERGDIPYFFRLYGRPGIHYYASVALTELQCLPLHGDVPQLDPMLSLSRSLRSPARSKLRQDGLFTLLGAFDHKSLTGQHSSDELSVAWTGRKLVVRLPGGDELETQRSLRAYVGSLYLPCECGEVRSVFVPAVTACATRRGNV